MSEFVDNDKYKHNFHYDVETGTIQPQPGFGYDDLEPEDQGHCLAIWMATVGPTEDPLTDLAKEVGEGAARLFNNPLIDLRRVEEIVALSNPTGVQIEEHGGIYAGYESLKISPPYTALEDVFKFAAQHSHIPIQDLTILGGDYLVGFSWTGTPGGDQRGRITLAEKQDDGGYTEFGETETIVDEQGDQYTIPSFSLPPEHVFATKFPLTCTPLGFFEDCFGFQMYWDKKDEAQYNNCTFPPQAKLCWGFQPTLYQLKGCKESKVAVDFIDLHDTLVGIFAAAYHAGEFDGHERVMTAWEHLNATTLHILYPLLNLDEVEADIERLKIEDAAVFAYLMVKYANDHKKLIRFLSDIAENIWACTDIADKLPGFIDEVLSRSMEQSGHWFVQIPTEPFKLTTIVDGSSDRSAVISRVDCPGIATQPVVEVHTYGADGSYSTADLPVASSVQVTGARIALSVVKAGDSAKYSCALGLIAFT